MTIHCEEREGGRREEKEEEEEEKETCCVRDLELQQAIFIKCSSISKTTSSQRI
jgi:hypothetical protein